MDSQQRRINFVFTIYVALAISGISLGIVLWLASFVIASRAFDHWLVITLLSLICVGVGYMVAKSLRAGSDATEPTLLDTPVRLARDPEVFEQYRQLSRSLLRISWQNDPIYREVALQRLAVLTNDLEQVSRGEIIYRETETWRIVYEQLLRSDGLHQYRSVSWMTTDSYWQDGPGRQSLKLNLELHEQHRITIERIVIVKDSDWLSDMEMPAPRIRQWIHEQHVHGIWIALVRESQLANEPDLLADFGIYGIRAVGFQKVDERARTTSFLLKFDFALIEEAEARWKRLQVYATSYGELLDHFTLDE